MTALGGEIACTMTYVHRSNNVCGKGCFIKKEKKMNLVSSLSHNCLSSAYRANTVELKQNYWWKWLLGLLDKLVKTIWKKLIHEIGKKGHQSCFATQVFCRFTILDSVHILGCFYVFDFTIDILPNYGLVTSKSASILITTSNTRSFLIAIRKTFDIHQLLRMKLKFTCLQFLLSLRYLSPTILLIFLLTNRSDNGFAWVFWGVCFRTLRAVVLRFEKVPDGIDLSKAGWTLWPT